MIAVISSVAPTDGTVLNHRFRPEEGDHRVEHREPDVLSLASALRMRDQWGRRLLREAINVGYWHIPALDLPANKAPSRNRYASTRDGLRGHGLVLLLQ